MSKRGRGLGKGLEALIPKVEQKEKGLVLEIEVENLTPNLFQPRKNFNKGKMEELKESIKKHGIIQPIVARKMANGYEIIAGERRLKAAQEIGLKKIPAIILVTNTIRLLKLNPEIQKNISEGKISFGHAKLLLSIEEEEVQKAVCERIIVNDLSVRDTEHLIKNIEKAQKKQFIREVLGTKINILYDGKKGKINIEFYSKEDLRRIAGLLLRER